MAIATLNTIKNWFKTGLKPTQAQFWDVWDSFRHKSDSVPAAEVSGLDALLLAKASNAVVDAQALLIELKENSSNKGVADGYAPLDSLAKIAAVYLNIVDDLTTGGSDALASAETVKTLKGLIDGINTLLASDNVDLNNVQELVDAIETVQTSLSTILINDLTTGGVTKALTAEQGKILKGLIDNKPAPTLSQVLAAGNSAQSTDGASSFRVTLSGVLEFLSQMVSGTSGGIFKNTVARSFLRNYTADNDTTFDINAGVPSISRYTRVGGTWFSTIFNFTPPTANTTINLPAKPAGTYTLATMDDIPPGGGSSPYKVWTALLAQSGTNAPTAIVQNNTLTIDPVITRVYTGYYDIELGSAIWHKIFVILTPTSAGTISSEIEGSIVRIRTQELNAAPYVNSDGILYNVPIEIRVYN